MKTIFSDVADVLGVPFRVALIPAENANRPGTTQGRKLTNGLYTTSTVHETANPARGASAEMHRQFVFAGGGPDGVSFHAVVDDHEIIQLLPLDEVAWHAGDGAHGAGNSTSIATETCINVDGDWAKTLDNLAKWQAFVLVNGSINTYAVLPHNHWSGKDCPHTIRHTPGGWAALLANIENYVRRLGMSGESGPITLNGHTIKQGFLELWNSFGSRSLEVCGLPLSDEYTVVEPALGNKSVTYMDFENVVFQWYDGIQPRICAGIRQYKYHQ